MVIGTSLVGALAIIVSVAHFLPTLNVSLWAMFKDPSLVKGCAQQDAWNGCNEILMSWGVLVCLGLFVQFRQLDGCDRCGGSDDSDSNRKESELVYTQLWSSNQHTWCVKNGHIVHQDQGYNPKILLLSYTCMLDGWMPWMSRKWIDKNKIEQTHAHHSYIHTYIHVCVHMIYIWSFIWSFIYTHTYIHFTCIIKYMACVHIHVCICMYVLIHIHVHAYYTKIHIHTCYMWHTQTINLHSEDWRHRCWCVHTVLPWGGICVRTVSPFNIYLTRTSPRVL